VAVRAVKALDRRLLAGDLREALYSTDPPPLNGCMPPESVTLSAIPWADA